MGDTNLNDATARKHNHFQPILINWWKRQNPIKLKQNWRYNFRRIGHAYAVLVQYAKRGQQACFRSYYILKEIVAVTGAAYKIKDILGSIAPGGSVSNVGANGERTEDAVSDVRANYQVCVKFFQLHLLFDTGIPVSFKNNPGYRVIFKTNGDTSIKIDLPICRKSFWRNLGLFKINI